MLLQKNKVERFNRKFSNYQQGDLQNKTKEDIDTEIVRLYEAIEKAKT